MKLITENKIFLALILIVAFCIVMYVGFMLIKFLPAIGKMLGVGMNIITIWAFIKYLKKIFNKEKE